jgi:hypothetical protein
MNEFWQFVATGCKAAQRGRAWVKNGSLHANEVQKKFFCAVQVAFKVISALNCVIISSMFYNKLDSMIIMGPLTRRVSNYFVDRSQPEYLSHMRTCRIEQCTQIEVS